MRKGNLFWPWWRLRPSGARARVPSIFPLVRGILCLQHLQVLAVVHVLASVNSTSAVIYKAKDRKSETEEAAKAELMWRVEQGQIARHIWPEALRTAEKLPVAVRLFLAS